MTPARDVLVDLFQAGIAAVGGRAAVARALQGARPPDRIIAVGKAAGDMCLGAQDLFGHDIPALVVTKTGHTPEGLRAKVIEAAHPVPDAASLRAGQELREAVAQMPEGSRLLLLVSGGASALAEDLPEGQTLAGLQARSDALLASGADIAQINAARKQQSRIKDGRLLAGFRGARLTICAISDVQGDAIGTIGSGIGDPKRVRCAVDLKLVATNETARNAVADAARAMGLPVHCNQESLYDDVFALARSIAATLKSAPPGICIMGGEPTIKLPPDPGLGGRNQALALALAAQIAGDLRISILVAGTDGTDGPNDAAGAVVDGQSFAPDAISALQRADAGSYLRRNGDVLITGPTGTNVMDLLIALIR